MVFFRMLGSIVELCYYKVQHIKPPLFDEGTPLTVVDYCTTKDEFDELLKSLGDTEYTVTEIDQTGNEWINGMEFESADQAQEALEQGIAYKLNIELAEVNTALIQLRDTEYLDEISGVVKPKMAAFGLSEKELLVQRRKELLEQLH